MAANLLSAATTRFLDIFMLIYNIQEANYRKELYLSLFNDAPQF